MNFSCILTILLLKMKKNILNRALNEAYRQSQKSELRCCHGATVVNRRGEIIASSYNKRDVRKNEDIFSTHAEISAFFKVPPSLRKGIKIIVLRRDVNTDKIIMSKPCKICQKMLERFNVKIYYSI